ncbi:MAG: hypothetical protein JOZ65_32625 [Chloroflexi bacterium]|nr:hypothetical protein [Chloroflexota bacterium]
MSGSPKEMIACPPPGTPAAGATVAEAAPVVGGAAGAAVAEAADALVAVAGALVVGAAGAGADGAGAHAAAREPISPTPAAISRNCRRVHLPA